MALSFQDIIMKLHAFWNDQGCVLWQPYNIQVGAGTGNPATLLRVLGPEPWRVAYVEPSVRPDDGRYGENPNRMQYYFQYQVILKPDPGNPQEIYLQSLEALGINPREHDIRFVEDNWESPALGAWGLGWEVWLDGQEITQFTYFQQAGGINLEPVSVEITYGLERIAIPLQGVNAAWDINFTRGMSYGDMFLRSEIEHCIYHFELADVEGLRQTYEIYEREHHAALERGLVIPAYDYVLKCSHLFNVLDTRGAIGVTERAKYFRRMRNMTLNIAKAYVQQREELVHPFQKLTDEWVPSYVVPELPTSLPSPTKPADFLLEIGVEELPSGDVDAALAALQSLAPAFFDELRLAHQGIDIYATPRRLVVYARGVAVLQSDETETIKGPPISVGLDANGNYTKAAEGFARKNGVSIEQLQRHTLDGGEYLMAVVERKGQSALAVLAETLPAFIAEIKFDKSMRWNPSGVVFSRPIRWLTALYGDVLVPFEYAQIISANFTRGLRPMGSPLLPLRDPASYFEAIMAQGVILDVAERRAAVREQINALAAVVGGSIPDDPALLDEVTNLVERPTALRGTFAERFLALPREVLITVMRKHQRYFAVENANGDLLPYFIAVRNGDAEHLDKVTQGNEQVLIARFTDAEFFYQADIKKPLADYLERLATLTFQEKLGSMHDKVTRIEQLVVPIGELLGAAEDLLPLAQRAAHLCKADLGTQMVVEMTSLQGTMGRIYANLNGEDLAVSAAIYEHWLPRGAGDVLPSSAAGVLLALIDRLDSLTGLFGVGLAPTGSADPYALRRAALGLVQILIDRDLTFDLRRAISATATVQPTAISPEQQNAVLDFIIGRLEVLLLERGEPNDVVRAVLAEQGHNPARAVVGVAELGAWLAHPDWANILDSFARCVRITRGVSESYSVDTALFQEPAEKALYDAYLSIQNQQDNVGAFVTAFAGIVPTVTEFFNAVMVMAEDEKLRQNRLGLLQALTQLAHGQADFSHLTGF